MPEFAALKDYGAGAALADDRLNRHHEMFLADCDVRGSKLLDVGCGRGLFLKTAEDRGAEVMGFDPDPANVASVERHGVRCARGLFDATADLAGFSPDIVTIFEVIEHVYDPHPMIEGARAILKPGGRLFVSTPNAFNIARLIKFALHQRHHDPHMDPVVNRDAQHIRGFSYGMTRDLLKMHGFKNVRTITHRALPRYFEQVVLMEASA